MRVIELALVMLVFHGSLAIVSVIDPFNAGSFADSSTTSPTMLNIMPSPPEEAEGTFAFIQRGMSSFSELMTSLTNVIFVGGLINTLMQQTTGLALPGPVALLLNAISGFIYTVAFIQTMLRYKMED